MPEEFKSGDAEVSAAKARADASLRDRVSDLERRLGVPIKPAPLPPPLRRCATCSTALAPAEGTLCYRCSLSEARRRAAEAERAEIERLRRRREEIEEDAAYNRSAYGDALRANEDFVRRTGEAERLRLDVEARAGRAHGAPVFVPGVGYVSADDPRAKVPAATEPNTDSYEARQREHRERVEERIRDLKERGMTDAEADVARRAMMLEID